MRCSLTPAQMEEVRAHLSRALSHLQVDADLRKLLNPRHTDHDHHIYTPKTVARSLIAARREIYAALAGLEREIAAISEELSRQV